MATALMPHVDQRVVLALKMQAMVTTRAMAFLLMMRPVTVMMIVLLVPLLLPLTLLLPGLVITKVLAMAMAMTPTVARIVRTDIHIWLCVYD